MKTSYRGHRINKILSEVTWAILDSLELDDDEELYMTPEAYAQFEELLQPGEAEYRTTREEG